MTPPAYPDARRLDLIEDLHGHPVADPYRWLEDPAAAQTQVWSAAQDELTRAALDPLPGREHLRGRLLELLGAGLVTPPVWRAGRLFFLQRSAEQEHAVLYWRQNGSNPDPEAHLLLDPIAVDPAGTTTLDAWHPSRDGRRLAHQLSAGGDEESLLRIIDVRSGGFVDGPIDRTRYSPVAWLPDSESFYYVRRLPPDAVPADETQFHRRVWLHRIGDDPADDALIHGEGLEKTNYYDVAVSRDGRWLVVSASAGTAPRDDVWIADLSEPGAGPASPRLLPLQVGVDAQTSGRVTNDGRLLLLTDRDAPRRRLCVADPTDPSYDTWTDLIPEDPEAVLEDYAVLDGSELERPLLLVLRTRHALAEVTLHDLGTGEQVGQVELPGPGTVAGLTARPEGGHEAWLGWTDSLTPPSVLRYDSRADELTTWARPKGIADVDGVHVEQAVYPSRDGTEVRMLVLSPAGRPDRPRPTVLYGYGGFNVSLQPAYAASPIAWVQAGGVWAIANLRGGSEEGEAWHRAGMRAHKQNVFDDFVAAAEHLIAAGWTTSQQLGISGGSNGGLLVGAALTQRPDLFASVACSAPLLDMVRYEQFGLGQTWNDEYGSAQIAEEFGWLLGYSPYHAVESDTSYPAVLFTVFDSDTRVDPLHARKMCAALQAASTADRPILIRRERDVGHGARSVSRTVELSVDVLAFHAEQLGLRWPG